MATRTITTERRADGRKQKRADLPPENERFLRCCADIANALIEDHESSARDPSAPRKDLNLNSLRSRLSQKHKIHAVPPLTAIIAAIPEHYKKYILPKLVARPIRTAPLPALHGLVKSTPSLLLMDRPSGSCFRTTGTSSGIAVVAVMCKPHR